MVNWKSFLALIGIVLLAAILSTLQLGQIIQNILKADPIFLLLAVLTTMITLASKGFKWRMLLFEQKNKVSLSQCVEVFIKGFFLSVITPGRIGDFSRALFIKDKVGFVFALSSVLLDRLIDIALLMILSLLGLAAFFMFFGIWILNPLIILAALLCMIIALAYVLKKKSKGFFRTILFSFVPEKYGKRVSDGYSELILELQKRAKTPGIFLVPVFLGILNWIIASFTGFFVGTALGIAQPVYFFGIVVLVLSLIEIIPISIGGIGTREAGAIFLFSRVGLSAETAVSFSLLYFCVGYVLVAVLGGLLFIRKPVQAD